MIFFIVHGLYLSILKELQIFGLLASCVIFSMQGLDPKFFEPTGASAVHVHGLLRANYQRTSHKETAIQPRDFVADSK